MTLSVENLPAGTTAAELAALFAAYGWVAGASVRAGPGGGASGLVRFDHAGWGAAAVALDGAEYHGRRLRVRSPDRLCPNFPGPVQADPRQEPTMTPTFHVRYTLAAPGRTPAPGDVRALDVPGELADLAGRLPAGAYLLSVEDLAAGRGVHWTRWPAAVRPGSADPATGRVAR